MSSAFSTLDFATEPEKPGAVGTIPTPDILLVPDYACTGSWERSALRSGYRKEWDLSCVAAPFATALSSLVRMLPNLVGNSSRTPVPELKREQEHLMGRI